MKYSFKEVLKSFTVAIVIIVLTILFLIGFFVLMKAVIFNPEQLSFY